MCGIAGIYTFSGLDTPEERLIRNMSSALSHRGPDGEGVYCCGNVGLGHRRLSIIDIEGGHQPMSNEDGSLWIVCNGEIYNFPQLKEELICKGHRFKTKSDTEVILHLYEEDKKNFISKLRGMFAFAIWNAKTKELILARDRVGIKPLHYAFCEGRLIFGSEIKAILQYPGIRRNIDYEALNDYLSVLYVPAPKTMFEGIYKLPAGHYMCCTPNTHNIEQYWDLDYSKKTIIDENDMKESVYRQLEDAVRAHLISDVPLGAFLSGGIDSSSIVAIMSQLQSQPIVTNSIGFSEKTYDELLYARIVSTHFSTQHHEHIVKTEASEIIDKLTDIYDEPFGDGSCIPTYYLSKIARQNVTVALSGDGGDENFAGYKRYIYSNNILSLQNMLPCFIKNTARHLSRSCKPNRANPWMLKVRNKLDELHLPAFFIYFKIISMYKEEEKSLLYSGSTKERMEGFNTQEKFYRIFQSCRSENYVSKLQYLDIKTYLCDDILTKVDRASMANSLEVRVPLLDHSFMEYVAGITPKLQYNRVSGKLVLKKAMSGILPREILQRSKMGFAVPMAHWMRNDLKHVVGRELFDKNGIVRELFDHEYVKNIWHLVQRRGIIDFRVMSFYYRVWLLFLLSRWHKRFLI
jgi:asparagine synthase (glutamine-hydrolysing)